MFLLEFVVNNFRGLFKRLSSQFRGFTSINYMYNTPSSWTKSRFLICGDIFFFQMSISIHKYLFHSSSFKRLIFFFKIEIEITLRFITKTHPLISFFYCLRYSIQIRTLSSNLEYTLCIKYSGNSKHFRVQKDQQREIFKNVIS